MASTQDLLQQLLHDAIVSRHDPTVQKAGEALRRLPKRMDRELLRRTLVWFADNGELSWYLWRAVRTWRAEHLDLLLEVLQQRATDSSERGLQARFLVAACDPAGKDTYDVFLRAARLVHHTHQVQSTGEIGATPRTEQDAVVLQELVTDDPLVAAAATAMEFAVREYPHTNHLYGSTGNGLFWHLFVLLVQPVRVFSFMFTHVPAAAEAAQCA